MPESSGSFWAAAIIVTVVFAGLFTYAHVVYSNDIAVTIHGMVTVANGYGSPYIADLFTNTQQLPFHTESLTPVTPLPNDNSTAYYSIIVISGHEYNVIVTVGAPGKGAVNNCALAHDLPSCTTCLAPRVALPFATTDYSYNITVSCLTHKSTGPEHLAQRRYVTMIDPRDQALGGTMFRTAVFERFPS